LENPLEKVFKAPKFLTYPPRGIFGGNMKTLAFRGKNSAGNLGTPGVNLEVNP